MSSNKYAENRHLYQDLDFQAPDLDQTTPNRVINIAGFDFLQIPTQHYQKDFKKETQFVNQSEISHNHQQNQQNNYAASQQFQPGNRGHSFHNRIDDRQPTPNNTFQWINSLAQFIKRAGHIFSAQQQQRSQPNLVHQPPLLTQANVQTSGTNSFNVPFSYLNNCIQTQPYSNYCIANDQQRIQALQLQSQYQQLQQQNELIRRQEQVILALRHREQERVRQLLVSRLITNAMQTANQPNNSASDGQKTRTKSSNSLTALYQHRMTNPFKIEEDASDKQVKLIQNIKNQRVSNLESGASPQSDQGSEPPASDDFQKKLILEDIKENKRLKEQNFHDSVLSYHGKQLRIIIDEIPQDDRIVIKHKMKRETPFTKNRKLTTSRYRGVYLSGKQYRCLFKKNGIIKKNLGYYQTEEEAARAYDCQDIRSHGIKANTNFAYSKGQISKILKDDIKRISKCPLKNEA